MTYDKNWTFQLNTEPTDQTTLQKQCQSWFIQLKTFLLSIGWVVESSSDSVTYSPTTDLWGTDLSKINWNTNTSARSWILLKSPIGIIAGLDGSYLGDQSRVWLVISATCTGTTTYYQWHCSLHREKPILNTPSITAYPTSSNGIDLATNSSQFLRSSLSPMRWQFAGTDKGNFYALCTVNGAVIMLNALILYPMSDIAQYYNKPYPYAIGAQVSYADATTHMTFYYTGQLGTTTLTHPNFNTWHINGVATVPVKYCLQYANPSIGGGQYNYYYGARLGASGDGAGNCWLMPIYLVSTSNGTQLPIGKVSDIKFSGMINLTNCTTDDNTNPTYCNFYNVWFPINTKFNS